MHHAMNMSELPPARRFITGHSDKGRAFFQFEGEVPYSRIPEASGRNSKFGVPWKHSQFPAKLDGDEDQMVIGGPIYDPKGTICRTVDIPPHTSSPFHRTVSLDYGIVVSGKIWLELDDGQERELLPGDIAVQRGTIHAWHNRTDEYTRIVWVLVAGEPFSVTGVLVDDQMHGELPDEAAKRLEREEAELKQAK